MDFVFLGFMAAMAVAGLVVGKLAGKNLAKSNLMSGSSWPAAKPIRLASIPYWRGCWRCTSSRFLPSGS